MATKTLRFALALLLAALVGCATGADAGDNDDDTTAAEDDSLVCHGDALTDDVPLSDDLDGLRQRWDQNKELLRILFVGEPF